MDHLDLDRWRRLLLAEANARDDGPSFVALQQAQARRSRARDELARFKTAGPQGHPSGQPLLRARPGDRMLPGVGGTQPDDITRVFEAGVRELEARVTVAEHEADRLAERLRECSERHTALARLVEAVRTWAAGQTPPVALPGDNGRIEPPSGLPGPRSVHIPGPAAGAVDFLGRPAS